MGWTSYHAQFYTNRGQVDRKKECDAQFTPEQMRIEKSVMVGSTYYAAVTTLQKYVDGNYIPVPPAEQKTWAAVFLTSVDSKDWYNFSYKDMDETCGPYKYDCPKGILDLLTPTDDEFALTWRKRCRENIERGGNKATRLRKLPIGTEIEFKDWQGNLHRFYKCAPSYQFKCPFWMNGNMQYIPVKRIPDDFRVVEERTR